MKDIDFDELDKAVNSLINPGNNPAPAPVTATTPAASTTPAPTPVSSAPAAPSPAERRSSGRFMDVVHPSSDMRPVSVPARPTQPESVSKPEPVSAPVPSKESKPATAWPDPIDVHEAATKKEEPTTSEPEPTPASTSMPASDTPAPLESPFLSDAKVEKRPLGAFSDEVHDAGPAASAVTPKPVVSSEESSLPTTDDIEKKPDRPIQSDTPMPAELQPGLLSIEANEDPKATATPETTAPTSITQQYKEQASTGDKPAGTVFDTDAYKKPQAAMKKKKSGWLVILWIVLLLIVGAGIGAAVYFFVLPRL